jgi:hypothetical protein
MKRLLVGLALVGLTACTGGTGENEAPSNDLVPDTPPTTVVFEDSTALRHAEYYPDDGTLLVEFRTQPDTYTYCEVPQSVFEELVSADSAGSYFHEHIAGTYDTAARTSSGWTC